MNQIARRRLRTWLLPVLVVNAAFVFVVDALYFVAKWFPYSDFLVRMERWLFRFF